MKKLFAACCAACLLLVIAVPSAALAATEVNVRIEGKEATLFEKTIPVDVHKIQASSDTEERDCDGVDPLESAVTPTLASADAMASIGESFDGAWFDGFDDYFITRWGPDEQDEGAGAFWGILVNEVLTPVGGCQFALDKDDEVLWVWNAFDGRPRLALFPEAAHYTSGSRPTRALARLGVPFPVEVVSFPAGGEGNPGDVPSRAGSSPFEGAAVAPVTTNPKGFQRVQTASPQAVTTNADGKATITFTEAGVHRIKAAVGAPGMETTALRSNGLDVCVAAKAGDCGEPLPSQGTAKPTGPPPPPPAARARISQPRLDRSRLGEGVLGVSWRVLDPGPGIGRWLVGAKRVGSKRGFMTTARGAKATAASFHLPHAGTY